MFHFDLDTTFSKQLSRDYNSLQFEKTTYKGMKFIGFDFKDITFINSTFHNCVFESSLISNVVFQGCKFYMCNKIGTIFWDESVILKNVNLTMG
ncbi:MAG: pentapeptide repeat-containing protein [Bacteroidetes bacterium]|nr:pentapeptide repeat-containing protein [Bacteroidota bacterium]